MPLMGYGYHSIAVSKLGCKIKSFGNGVDIFP